MARLVVRGWPDTIHRMLKDEAVKRGVSLREVLLEAVRLWQKQERKGAKRKK